MAYDDLTTEWHLTPNGWIKGTSRFFGEVQGEKLEPPPDRVASYRLRVYRQSRRSGEDLSWARIWGASDPDDAGLAELHPECIPEGGESR